MQKTDAVDAAVTLLYEAALDESLRGEAMAAFARAFDAPQAIRMRFDFERYQLSEFCTHGHDSAVTDRYAASVAQHERARGALAGGVATAYRAWQRPVPISFERGVGSRLWDVDGNEYVDYALAFGPMFLGHSPEPVISAVERQLGRAERRLHAALKALAVLRRLRGPGVGVQVNVAQKMVVDNRGG